MFRVLTVAREFGSGGLSIARKISESLGWELLDKALILEIARAMRVDSELVGQYDERLDSWLHRLSRRGLWHGAFEGVATVADDQVLDAQTVAELTRRVIDSAYQRGNCVIVGRGSQCLLQNRTDVLHIFIYAPLRERMTRVRTRMSPDTDIEALFRSTDRQRAEYIRQHFGCDWSNPHLYHMLINSELGEDHVASIVVEAISRAR